MSLVSTPHEGPSTGEPAPSFQQKLGLFDATMLVAGTMIGSGIFIVSADIARDVGASGWLLVVWLVTGIMTLIGALSYAELAAMMPQAGGQYIYLREAYGPLWGFLYGWTLFLVIQTGSIAAVAVAVAKFLGVLVPPLGTEEAAGAWVLHLTPAWTFSPKEAGIFSFSAGQILAVGVIGLLTWLNCLGVREGKWVQNFFTLAKTLALVALILVGFTVAGHPQAIEANWNNLWSGIYQSKSFLGVHQILGGRTGLVVLMVVGAAMVGSLFSADAWNNVTFTAGEVKNPRRTLPLSLAIGTSIVIVLYLLANLAYLAALPLQGGKNSPTSFQRGIAHAQDDRVATAVMEQAWPHSGPALMAGAIIVSAFGCVNGMVLMGARLYYAMARDGLFFQAVGQLNRRGVPAAGLVLQGAWASLLVFSGSYNQLLDYVIFAALVFYVLTVLGLFVLRRQQPALKRPYQAFGYPILPALYVFLCTAIMLDLLVIKPEFTWPGLIIVLTGIPVYYWWRKRSWKS